MRMTLSLGLTLSLVIMCLVGSAANAQCPASQSAPQSILPLAPMYAKVMPSSAPQFELTATPEETQFLATGPRLYPMDKALQISKVTGKPVICWMGKHLFSDERARALSTELADTTIQAVMDRDGTIYDSVGPRVKFTNGNYSTDSKTYYKKLINFDKPGAAEEILSVARGGGR